MYKKYTEELFMSDLNEDCWNFLNEKYGDDIEVKVYATIEVEVEEE